MPTPTLWQRILFRLLPSREREQMQADMLELSGDRRARVGHARTAVWLSFHTLLLAVRLRWHACTSGGSGGGLAGIVLDLKHVTRGLRASRLFTAVAVVSLAVGIGANASIYSVIRTLLLDEMAVPAPEQLSLVYWHQPGELDVSQMNSSGGQDPVSGASLRSNVSYSLAQDLLRTISEGIDGFAFNFTRALAISFDDRPAVIAGGMAADAGYFRVLSPRMALGRPLGVGDDRADAPPVVVLSHPFFVRAFGGDSAVLGRSLRINGISAEVVGVTAPGFRGLSKGGFFPTTEVTVPLRLFPALHPDAVDPDTSMFTSERMLWVRVMLRVPSPELRATLPLQLARVIPPHVAAVVSGEGAEPIVVLRPGARGLDQTRPETRRLLYVLMGVVVAVLLIACVNLAGLVLARGVARQREMALRRALGASRFRLIRASLLEGVVLALAGGLLGLLFTFWSRRILTTLLTSGLGTAPLSNQTLEVSVDLPLVAVTFGVSVIAAIFFSLLPAVRLTTSDRAASLGHRAAGPSTPKLTLGRALVALQIAVSVPLLVTAVLFLRTVANLGGIDMGFTPTDVAFAKVEPSPSGVSDVERAETYLRILNQVRTVPGVMSASLIENPLLSGLMSSNRTQVDGVDYNLYMNAVGPDFLDTMGVALLAGRSLGIQDGPDAPLTGLLNETAARTLFGTTTVVGRTIPWRGRTLEIVGVVGDTRYDSPRADVPPTLFDSALQRNGYGGHNLLVKSRRPRAELDSAIRQAVAAVNRDIPVPALKSQVGQMEEATMRERVFARLLTIFGGFALLLVGIGLHGVTSYSVSRRTNEIGVRMALGAQPSQVLWMVQRQVVVLVAIGLVVGVPAALAAGTLFSALLFGVAPTDLVVLTLGAGVMLAVAIAAGWIPAYRAAHVDPLKALRTD